jgi:hypothetical protein
VTGCCYNGNEPPGYIKGGEFLDQLSGYQMVHLVFCIWSPQLTVLLSPHFVA